MGTPSVVTALGVAVLLGRACLFFTWCRGPLADGIRRIEVGSNNGDWRVIAGGFSESVSAIVGLCPVERLFHLPWC